jgi:hypothetical protein
VNYKTKIRQFSENLRRFFARAKNAGFGRVGSLDRTVPGLTIEVCRERDGRWIAEVWDIPGALAYGRTREEAITNAKAIARLLRSRIV